MKEKFYYDMARMEAKSQKMRDLARDGKSTPVDIEDLTVSDEDFQEHERERFA